MICTSYDDFVAELESDKGQALWRVELSDGTEAIMDDGRPAVSHHSAWVRLASHLEGTGLKIRKMWLGFRSNVKKDILSTDADGYYFCKSALGQMNSNETFSFFLVGDLRNGKLMVQRWQVPELILIDIEERDPAKAGQSLIRNRIKNDTERTAIPCGQTRVDGIK